ncbi:MAG TPA: hypothetical protein G4O11_01640 [Anaerolineae bacterium]|nr:hypothetical protein [Anaerolineae bacterium]
MKEKPLQDQIILELEQAYQFRTQGKEGRARVCARRAAGWAVAVFRQQRLEVETHRNAYHQLRWFRKLEDIPIELRMAAERLTTPVTPSHELPHREDPLKDAEMIVRALLDEWGYG